MFNRRENFNDVLTSIIIAIYRRIFWIDTGTYETSIQSSKMTGADRQLVVQLTRNVNRVVGLCADVEHRRLYWSDREIGTISTSEYDGSDFRHFPLPRNYATRLISLSVGAVSVFD